MTSPWPRDPTGTSAICCMCFLWFPLDQLHQLPDGSREDVCERCAEKEARVGQSECRSSRPE